MWAIPFVVAALVVVSGSLAASETALFSLLRMRSVRARLSAGTAYAVDQLLNRPFEFLMVIGSLSECANVFAESLAAAWMLAVFGRRGAYLTVPIMFTIMLVFAEITPKTFALAHPSAIIRLTARPLWLAVALISPLVRRFMAHFRVSAEPISKTEFQVLLRLGEDQGQVKAAEREVIRRVFEFSSRRVADIMTPRERVFSLSIDTPPEKLIAECARGHFSRVPVYRGDPDNIVGVLHVKDLVVRRLETTPTRLERLLRRPRFVPPNKRVGELFEEMRRERVQLVLVVDEYGKLLGLATFEDLLEELFGEIRDEFDVQIPEMVAFPNGEMLVSGSIELSRLNQVLQKRGRKPLANGEPTLGRLIVQRLGRIPRRGERLSLGNLAVVVEKVRGASVELVRVK